MPRKGPIPRREVLPDPIYGSRLAARFVNRLMYDGKKGAAEKIFYGALEVLAEKTGEEALRAFEKALENVKPHLEVKARRVAAPPIRCLWKCVLTARSPFHPLVDHLRPFPW